MIPRDPFSQIALGDLGEPLNLSPGLLLHSLTRHWGEYQTRSNFGCFWSVSAIALAFRSFLACELMYSSVRNKQKRKDRERKAGFVRCECSLSKGTFCLAKKAHRHNTVFGNKAFHCELSIQSDDREFSGQFSDSSSSLSAGHQSPTMEVHSTHSNEDDNSMVGCEIQQENFASDSNASSDSSDLSRKDDFGRFVRREFRFKR